MGGNRSSESERGKSSLHMAEKGQNNRAASQTLLHPTGRIPGTYFLQMLRLRRTVSQPHLGQGAAFLSEPKPSAASAKSATEVKMTSEKAHFLAKWPGISPVLPKPYFFRFNSDPHADLCAHLQRHGLLSEAQDFESAMGITADFVLRTWSRTSSGGAEELLRQISIFFPTNGFPQVRLGLPVHFDIPVEWDAT
jgi:hypothetical protein